jgi:hypothetical protein
MSYLTFVPTGNYWVKLSGVEGGQTVCSLLGRVIAGLNSHIYLTGGPNYH